MTTKEKMKDVLNKSMQEGDPLVTGEPLSGGDTVVKKLAQGGMGDLYLGYHFGLDRRVAVKFLLRFRNENDDEWDSRKERFIDEARLMEKVKHPGIPNVKYFGTGDENTPPYLVMDFIKGECLGDLFYRMEEEDSIKRRKLSWKLELLRRFPDVCDALAAVHSKGMIHRDIKPDNLMLSTWGDNRSIIKVIDFGIALKDGVDRHTKDGLVVGTVDYMSPEQAHGQSITKLVDVYCLGSVLFELLHYEGFVEPEPDPLATFDKVFRDGYLEKRLEQLDLLEGRALVSLAMAKNPADRFGGMYELKGAIMLLIKQIEYMLENDLKSCTPEVTSQIFAKLVTDGTFVVDGVLRILLLIGAGRLMARQFEFLHKEGYPKQRQSSAQASIRDYSKSSSAVVPYAQPYDDTDMAPHRPPRPRPRRRNRRWARKAAYGIGSLGLLMLIVGLTVYFWPSKKQRQKNYTSSVEVIETEPPRDADTPPVVTLRIPDASAKADASRMFDASVKPDASVPTPAQKTKALYEKRDKWCHQKDPRARDNGFMKMWTFHLDCHCSHLYEVGIKQEQYVSGFRYAKYLYQKFCTDSLRKRAEKPLVKQCEYLLRRYKKILNSIYLKDPEAYKKYREWLPFQRYWAKQRRKRKRWPR